MTTETAASGGVGLGRGGRMSRNRNQRMKRLILALGAATMLNAVAQAAKLGTLTVKGGNVTYLDDGEKAVVQVEIDNPEPVSYDYVVVRCDVFDGRRLVKSRSLKMWGIHDRFFQLRDMEVGFAPGKPENHRAMCHVERKVRNADPAEGFPGWGGRIPHDKRR
jgi:hypothetical protein